MEKTLHIQLKAVGNENVELRCYFANPNDFTKRSLRLADIDTIIRDAESGYYTLLPADFARTGRKLYQWLDGSERFLARAMEKCLPADEMTLAIEATGKLAHLPWEVMHDGNGFLVQKRYPHIVPVRWQNRPSDVAEPANRPLRVLFMATAPLNVKPELDFEREEGLILDATQRQPLMLAVGKAAI